MRDVKIACGAHLTKKKINNKKVPDTELFNVWPLNILANPAHPHTPSVEIGGH